MFIVLVYYSCRAHSCYGARTSGRGPGVGLFESGFQDGFLTTHLSHLRSQSFSVKHLNIRLAALEAVEPLPVTICPALPTEEPMALQLTLKAAVLLLSTCTALFAPARQLRTPQALRAAPTGDAAKVLYLHGDGVSDVYGASSPRPKPTHAVVAAQLARRVGHFDAKVSGTTEAIEGDVVIGLGVTDVMQTKATLANLKPACFVADGECSEEVRALAFCEGWAPGAAGPLDVVKKALPFTTTASWARLLAQSELLLGRGSSEDALFAALFLVHALVTPCAVVASDINPSWEKGVLRNIREFKTMTDCCGPEIAAALSDPKTKAAIDLLNAGDLRDQVGSYRVLVSNETPQLEEFTRCILQQNNCFQSDASILTEPQVPCMTEWRGKPIDLEAARQLFIGHLEDPASASSKQPWSWKIVVGANPAYDAFPMQHQIFYPTKSGDGLWYDPVFCVETLEGELVWTKRHYRCVPRNNVPGLWTLTTLDNGIVSEEHWTTVDAAEDLSWAIFHYSGAARKAGQSYQGALLCSEDGLWPEMDADRIEGALAACGLELWELYGHGPDATQMWSDSYTRWKDANPPPLERIGDMTIKAWRKQERAAATSSR